MLCLGIQYLCVSKAITFQTTLFLKCPCVKTGCTHRDYLKQRQMAPALCICR